jgi:nucleoid DNA-binding protein
MPTKSKVMDLEHIVRQVAERTQGTIKDTSKVVDALLDVLSENLQKGHTIHLADFATLTIPPQKSSEEQ